MQDYIKNQLTGLDFLLNILRGFSFALFNKPRPQKLHKEILWNNSLRKSSIFLEQVMKEYQRKIFCTINHIYPKFDISSQPFQYNHRISCERIFESKSAKEYSKANPRKNIRKKIRSEYLSENLLWEKICETIFLENEGDSYQGGFNAKEPIVFALFNKPRPQKLQKEILWNISLRKSAIFFYEGISAKSLLYN